MNAQANKNDITLDLMIALEALLPIAETHPDRQNRLCVRRPGIERKIEAARAALARARGDAP
jgi:hypothetical protein